MWRHELHHVLVAGNDEDFVLPTSAASRASVPMTSSASKPSDFEDRNAQRFERTANVGNLAAKVLRHGFAFGLVALIVDIFKALRF